MPTWNLLSSKIFMIIGKNRKKMYFYVGGADEIEGEMVFGLRM